ncbi:MAG: hypothetical protein Q8M86_06005 [Syntrophales bacterium]|nr:hypothetical protein [Syntrophales bacterium]
MNWKTIMKENWKIIVFLLFMILIKENAAFCQSEKISVESNGLVQKSSSGFDVDRKSAIIAALREAVEKACGVSIQSKTKVEDFIVVKDVINTELSNRNNEMTMSDYRIVFEPRGYTKIDNSDMLEVKLEVSFKKRSESSSAVIPSKKQKNQQEEIQPRQESNVSPAQQIPRPATTSQLYCCDGFGIARCPIVAQPGPVGTACFCFGQGWGIICVK